MLYEVDLTVYLLEPLLLLELCRLVIDVHRRSNIPVPHDILHDLDIRLVLA